MSRGPIAAKVSRKVFQACLSGLLEVVGFGCRYELKERLLQDNKSWVLRWSSDRKMWRFVTTDRNIGIEISREKQDKDYVYFTTLSMNDDGVSITFLLQPHHYLYKTVARLYMLIRSNHQLLSRSTEEFYL